MIMIDNDNDYSALELKLNSENLSASQNCSYLPSSLLTSGILSQLISLLACLNCKLMPLLTSEVVRILVNFMMQFTKFTLILTCKLINFKLDKLR